MNEGLWSLVSLQETDLKIMELNRKIAKIPADLATLDAQLAAHDSMLAKNKERLADAHKERRRLEGEVDLLRGKLSKYKEQLMAVKKNEEYTAVLKEIETCKTEINRAEDRILEDMEFSDALDKEMKAKEAEFRLERERILREKSNLQNHDNSLRSDLERLQAQRTTLVSQVPYDLFAEYSRIAGQRRGIAVAEARDEACQACHVRLRPQVYTDVRQSVHIIRCESCTRILYWKEHVPVQVRTDA